MTDNNYQPIEITPHLYQLGVKKFPAYLSMGENAMIIEGGTGATTEILIKQIDMLGIDPSKIRYMVLPHTHPDHVGAVPRLRDVWPNMKIIAGELGAKFLAKESFIKGFLPADDHITQLLLEKKYIGQAPKVLDTYNFNADETVSEGDKIDLGNGIVWQIISAPGHCPDHIALFEATEGTLVIGDTTGYYDPDLDVFWPNYFASLEGYCNTIRKLAAIPANRILLSHNGVISSNVKNYFERSLKAAEKFHKELITRLDAGEDQKEIAKEKAKWVFDFAPLAPVPGIVNLNMVMMNHSLAERDKDLFFFP